MRVPWLTSVVRGEAIVTLSLSELVALTRRDRPSAQARILRLLGIPFATHPVDGTLIVSRAAAEKMLGAVADASESTAEAYEVNLEAMRGHHGTSTDSR